MGDQVSLSSFHRDIGIPINFQEVSSLVIFWSLEFHEPLEVSRDVRPPVQMRREISVSSRISIQDSDISPSCQIKDYPAFKPLQRNPALFLVGKLSIHSTWGRKFRVPLTYLLLREGSSSGDCLKLAYLFNRILGISSLLEMILGSWSIPRVPVLKLVSYKLKTCVSGNFGSCLKEVKPLVVYDGEQGIVLEPMQGTWS